MRTSASVEDIEPSTGDDIEQAISEEEEGRGTIINRRWMSKLSRQQDHWAAYTRRRLNLVRIIVDADVSYYILMSLRVLTFILLNSYIINSTEKCSNSSYFIKFHEPPRLTKFVRRLHTMLTQERSKGVIEWRRGLLVLYSMEAFTNELLPKYFNTHNFKTFRRQLKWVYIFKSFL